MYSKSYPTQKKFYKREDPDVLIARWTASWLKAQNLYPVIFFYVGWEK